MPYCPKCGNQVEDGMTFCPRCGASLKLETPSQTAPTTAPPPPARQEKAEKGEKNEKREKQEPEKGEKHEGRFGFLGFLVAGLVLIILGALAYINAEYPNLFADGVAAAAALLLIGLVIIIVGIYVASKARKRMPQVVQQA